MRSTVHIPKNDADIWSIFFQTCVCGAVAPQLEDFFQNVVQLHYRSSGAVFVSSRASFHLRALCCLLHRHTYTTTPEWREWKWNCSSRVLNLWTHSLLSMTLWSHQWENHMKTYLDWNCVEYYTHQSMYRVPPTYLPLPSFLPPSLPPPCLLPPSLSPSILEFTLCRIFYRWQFTDTTRSMCI